MQPICLFRNLQTKSNQNKEKGTYISASYTVHTKRQDLLYYLLTNGSQHDSWVGVKTDTQFLSLPTTGHFTIINSSGTSSGTISSGAFTSRSSSVFAASIVFFSPTHYLHHATPEVVLFVLGIHKLLQDGGQGRHHLVTHRRMLRNGPHPAGDRGRARVRELLSPSMGGTVGGGGRRRRVVEDGGVGSGARRGGEDRRG